MKTFILRAIAIGSLISGIGASPLMAIPQIYQCRLIDFLASGPVRTDFHYIVGSGYQSFKSDFSEVRFNYSSQDAKVLYLSLRPHNNVETYASREDKGTPLHVTLTHVASDYAATVKCNL